jgi:hypothetical protein
VNPIFDGHACRYKVLDDRRRQILGSFAAGDLCDLRVFLVEQGPAGNGAPHRLAPASRPLRLADKGHRRGKEVEVE